MFDEELAQTARIEVQFAGKPAMFLDRLPGNKGIGGELLRVKTPAHAVSGEGVVDVTIVHVSADGSREESRVKQGFTYVETLTLEELLKAFTRDGEEAVARRRPSIVDTAIVYSATELEKDGISVKFDLPNPLSLPRRSVVSFRAKFTASRGFAERDPDLSEFEELSSRIACSSCYGDGKHPDMVIKQCETGSATARPCQEMTSRRLIGTGGLLGDRENVQVVCDDHLTFAKTNLRNFGANWRTISEIRGYLPCANCGGSGFLGQI